MRRRLPLALLAALGGCGSPEDRSPALDTIPPAALASRFYPPEGWTWGLLQVAGAAPHRYGVAGPRRSAIGHLVIVPGAFEPAEKWFETARALIDAGWTVWILDLAGQGGSGRQASARDMAYVRDMAVDVDALRTLVAEVTRPAEGERLVLLAHSIGAADAVLALSGDLPEVDAAILSAPTVRVAPGLLPMPADRLESVARWARRLGMGDRFAWGQDGWSSDEVTGPPVTHDRARGAVQGEWMRANPPLRLGGASWAWTAALLQQARRARSPTLLAAVSTPVTVIAPTEDTWAAPGSAAELCRALPRCTYASLAGSRHEPHMEIETVRARWLALVMAAAAAPAASPARTP